MKRKHTHTITVYRAADGWRWRLQALNGKTVADSGEAYVRKRNAEKVARALETAVMRVVVQE